MRLPGKWLPSGGRGPWCSTPLPLLIALALAGGCASTATRSAASARAFGAPPGDAQESPATGGGEGEANATDEGGLPLHGTVSARVRARSTSGTDDADLHALANVDWGDAERDRVTFHALGRATVDLDGRDDGGVFGDITDTYSERTNGRLYELYADVHDVAPLETLRVGRQLVVDTPEVLWFDGLRAESAEHGARRARAGVYGGVPVHQFESSPEGDFLAGAFAQARPWKGGRVRVDYTRFEDENRLGPHDNDLVGVEAWQSVSEKVGLQGEFELLDGEERDYRLRASYADPEQDLTLQASWYELLKTERDLAIDIDPYFASLTEYFPFHQAQLAAAKGFGESYVVQAGVDARQVDDANDVSEFNRDFERYFLSFGLLDLLPAGIELTLTADAWDGDQSETETWGVDLSTDVSERSEVAVGSYYSLYKFDYYFGQERDHVRTYYLKLRLKRTERTTFDLRYEYEDDDFEDYQSLRLGALWRF